MTLRCPYPLEETRFEDRNDSSGFINATPYGVPINILEEMLLAGMLLDDDPQTLSERISNVCLELPLQFL